MAGKKKKGHSLSGLTISTLSDVRCHANPHTTIVLVGNKSDLDESKRQVTYEEADRFAKENGIALFLETSAKSASNVEEVFVKAAEHVYEKIKSGEFTNNEVKTLVSKRGTVLIICA